MTTSKAILSILAIILASLFVWVVGQPPPRRPNVSVLLLGYTNDSSGPLAIIGVTNRSSDTILIYRPTIEMPAAMKPRGFSYYLASQTNQWARFRLSLKKGLFGTFTVQPPPPTNQSPWRVSSSSILTLERLRGLDARFSAGECHLRLRLNGLTIWITLVAPMKVHLARTR